MHRGTADPDRAQRPSLDRLTAASEHVQFVSRRIATNAVHDLQLVSGNWPRTMARQQAEVQAMPVACRRRVETPVHQRPQDAIVVDRR